VEPDVIHSHPARRRDWYWFLGRLGQSLILLGILMLLFVGYQLWGTGIEESQAQNRLESTFFDYGTSSDDAGDLDGDGVAVGTLAPDTTVTDVGNTPPVESSRPVAVDEGDPVAIIEIPDLGVTKFVVAGVAAADLKKGPGHYPMTPQPGHLGNVAIAGHRTTYGEPFRQLDELDEGDDIIVTDVRGREFVYQVTESFVVEPDDSWVVATTDPTRALLTLTTCHPEFSAKQRLIVTAELDTSRSAVVDDRPFRYATEPIAVETSPSTIVSEDLTPDESTIVSDTTSPPVSDTIPTASTVDFEVETFSEGWFSDPAAWPHVLGWLAVLLGVVAGGWLIHRRWMSRLLAFTLTTAPFFVVLYFVFQNVNRLLPPNL
jgi:sortase A